MENARMYGHARGPTRRREVTRARLKEETLFVSLSLSRSFPPSCICHRRANRARKNNRACTAFLRSHIRDKEERQKETKKGRERERAIEGGAARCFSQPWTYISVF